MEENTSEERPSPEAEPGPEHSATTWRACCLAPTIALALVLIFAVGAYLYNGGFRLPGTQTEVQDEETLQRRATFIEFGRSYFAIAHRADRVNEAAFRDLNALVQGDGSIDTVHAAFREASEANARAAAEFKELTVPPNLLARDKLRRSIDTMSDAYDARRRACETLVAWNGDLEDEATAEKYTREVQEVNSLTMEGLRYLGEAAEENGVTRDDVERFLPAEMIEPWGLDVSPFTPRTR